MSKILLKINHEEELMYPVDGYILCIKDFSNLTEKTFSIDEIKEVVKDSPNKEIYASLNRCVFNDELDKYKRVLTQLDELHLNGIIVSDIAALTYNLKTKLILDQGHLNNSYYSINHYLNNNVSGVYLTNDITVSEIDEIRKNTKSTLFKQVFGYTHLSTSKRMLVSNYLKHFNKNNKSNYYMINEDKSNEFYKIIEDSFGTHIISPHPINLLGYDMNVDYIVIDGFLLDNIKDVCDIFKSNDISKKKDIDMKYNANEGFINTKTIYKVKKDEK